MKGEEAARVRHCMSNGVKRLKGGETPAMSCVCDFIDIQVKTPLHLHHKKGILINSTQPGKRIAKIPISPDVSTQEMVKEDSSLEVTLRHESRIENRRLEKIS